MGTLVNSDLKIEDIIFWDEDIPLTDRFTISGGSLPAARNLFIRLTLRNGAVGFGECAPFAEITGEDRNATENIISRLKPVLLERPVYEYRDISRIMSEMAPANPAARCGLETAILDAFCRSLGIPLWAFFGGVATGPYETDVTIPILDKGRCLELAEHWYQQGFRILKMKIGANLDSDLANITAISKRFTDVSIIADANQGLDEKDALGLVKSLKKINADIRCIEQPVHKADIMAMARLRSESPFPICADESVASRKDATDILKSSAADIINIKIMKSGVIEAYDIALFALAGGMEIMFGGMVETRLAMSCSLAMAASVGPVHTLDLDTPLLMTYDPWNGGYGYKGPTMTLSPDPGLGITPRS
jgi:L-alanine-DL-glutamate epimerase-like enolase superfamily enzyme